MVGGPFGTCLRGWWVRIQEMYQGSYTYCSLLHILRTNHPLQLQIEQSYGGMHDENGGTSLTQIP